MRRKGREGGQLRTRLAVAVGKAPGGGPHRGAGKTSHPVPELVGRTRLHLFSGGARSSISGRREGARKQRNEGGPCLTGRLARLPGGRASKMFQASGSRAIGSRGVCTGGAHKGRAPEFEGATDGAFPRGQGGHWGSPANNGCGPFPEGIAQPPNNKTAGARGEGLLEALLRRPWELKTSTAHRVQKPGGASKGRDEGANGSPKGSGTSGRGRTTQGRLSSVSEARGPGFFLGFGAECAKGRQDFYAFIFACGQQPPDV